MTSKFFAEEFTTRHILFPENESFWYETLRSFGAIAYPDDPRHYHAFDRSVECFQAAARLFTTPVQPVAIPYEDTTLSGYF